MERAIPAKQSPRAIPEAEFKISTILNDLDGINERLAKVKESTIMVVDCFTDNSYMERDVNPEAEVEPSAFHQRYIQKLNDVLYNLLEIEKMSEVMRNVTQ